MTAGEIGQIMMGLGEVKGAFGEFTKRFERYERERAADSSAYRGAMESRVMELEEQAHKFGRFTLKDVGILLAGVASGVGIIAGGGTIGWW